MNHLKNLLVGSFVLLTMHGYSQTPSDTLRNVQMQEVVVTGNASERNLKAPQMGRVSMSSDVLRAMPVMFAEPDIVKTLQTQPGVTQGIEGFTGLYVRGGNDDQNLFLYQGLPLYQVSHLGGIFSSFNVATVRKVDFYKASFPAQYGGRVSSITDISMETPNFESYHGRLSLGLLSGSAYVTGPLAKNKTAFSAGLRRSWIDLVSMPTLAIVNATQKKKGTKTIAAYAFTDLNLRLDHKFSNKLTASIVGYYGHDNMKIGSREFEKENDAFAYNNDKETMEPMGSGDKRFYDQDVNRMSWGNWGAIASLDWMLRKGKINLSAYYSDYGSTYKQEKEYQRDLSDKETFGFIKNTTHNAIRDVGAKASYYAEFGKIYEINAGLGGIHHNYMPEELLSETFNSKEKITRNNNADAVKATEWYAYVDNVLNLSSWLSVNAGVRAANYRAQGQTYNMLEPRASVRVNITQDYSIKAGYARMNQVVQQLSNNYVNLPTDLWQPVAGDFKPLQSDLYTIGVYGNLPLSMYFSVEGWYKNMQNILEYKEGVTSIDPNVAWVEKLTSGKGWAYGVDLSVTKTAGKFTGTAGYGLMWNWREFADLNRGEKFPAKFDNRHKFNLNVNYKLNEHIDFNAGWMYMTGNRVTLSLYNQETLGTDFPDAPQTSDITQPNDYYDLIGLDYLSTRNNIRMPAYHRLDLGMNLHKKLRNGREGIWNFSLYNAYCYMNALTIKKDRENNYGVVLKENWRRAFKKVCLLPAIPSVSYTYIF